jgi:hypothetical protein
MTLKNGSDFQPLKNYRPYRLMIKMKKIVAVVFILSGIFPWISWGQGLVILYNGDTAGHVEPCG